MAAGSWKGEQSWTSSSSSWHEAKLDKKWPEEECDVKVCTRMERGEGLLDVLNWRTCRNQFIRNPRGRHTKKMQNEVGPGRVYCDGRRGMRFDRFFPTSRTNFTRTGKDIGSKHDRIVSKERSTRVCHDG